MGKSPEEYNSSLCFETCGAFALVAPWAPAFLVDSAAVVVVVAVKFPPPLASSLVIVLVDPIGHNSYPSNL
jgi:hypothetical protein